MTRVVTVSSEENVENNLLLSLPRGSPVESTRSLSEPDRALSQATSFSLHSQGGFSQCCRERYSLKPPVPCC